MDARELYQDIILDHGRHPRNFRAQPDANHVAHGHNPLCGDRVTVYVKLDGDTIKDLSFEGRGCAISTASASLMTEVLKGKSVAAAEELFKCFHAEVTGRSPPPHAARGLEDEMERLAPLAGVKDYPTRVKCATLAWHAFEAALKNGAAASGQVATVKTE
jgi:nitrogen fixation protein NifU and related proteins